MYMHIVTHIYMYTYPQITCTNPRAPRRDVPAGRVFTYGAGLLPPLPPPPNKKESVESKAIRLLLQVDV